MQREKDDVGHPRSYKLFRSPPSLEKLQVVFHTNTTFIVDRRKMGWDSIRPQGEHPVGEGATVNPCFCLVLAIHAME